MLTCYTKIVNIVSTLLAKHQCPVCMQPLVIKSAASQSHLWAAALVLFVLGYFTPALVWCFGHMLWAWQCWNVKKGAVGAVSVAEWSRILYYFLETVEEVSTLSEARAIYPCNFPNNTKKCKSPCTAILPAWDICTQREKPELEVSIILNLIQLIFAAR